MMARAMIIKQTVGLSRNRRSEPSLFWTFLSAYHYDAPISEYTDKPQYPEIVSMTREAIKQREKEAWHEKVKQLPTLEQKIIELNMAKYFGFWSCQLSDVHPMLTGKEFSQYATRTHVTHTIPQEYYKDVWAAAEAAAERAAGPVEDLINLNYYTQLQKYQKEGSVWRVNTKQTNNFLFGLHRVLLSAIDGAHHIKEATVDLRPRLEAYWILGNMPPDAGLKKRRKNFEPTKDRENEPIERPMQGVSRPLLGLRVEDGLPAVVERDDPLSTSSHVPADPLDPRAYGFKFRHRPATTVTGYWLGEKKEYGHFFLHTHGALKDKLMKKFGSHVVPDAFIHKALVSSFTQAYAHATYLGFGPVTELTYPVVQQSAYTDGQHWNLSLYQLNTSTLHSDLAINNPYNNILWLGEEQQLFEGVDEGGVRGLNTSLLTAILAMYLKKGVPNPDPSPYLPLKQVANHPAREDYREDFHKMYLHLCSNRPRARPKPEIYLWEKIYKIDHNTRPLDTPKRFFEGHIIKKNPNSRRLDDYIPPYIPKALREEKRVRYKPRLNSEHLYKYEFKWHGKII